MTNSVWHCVACIAVFVNWPAMAANSDDGFRSMFDGKSLNGWTVTPESAKQAWSANDGMIVGTGDKGRSYLQFDQGDIADFELKFSYRFPGKGNSGVNIRASHDETGKRDFKAYHVDLGHAGIGKQVLGAWDFHTPGRKEHRCFRGDRLVIDENDQPTITEFKKGLALADINKNGWNDVHVIVRDNRFRFFINHKLASEFTEHLPMKKRLHKGWIQFQLHDPGMVVQFQNLRIKVNK